MKRKLFNKLILLGLATFNNIFAQQLAFPTAEGFGKYTKAGRGGTVVHVTNLNDSGAGSLRDAVSQSNRIVVFDVGGVINIQERIVVSGNVYIAGQTAPGGGITVYGNGMAYNASNNITRYIRIRMGKNGDNGKDALSISSGQNKIFDNVSISWGRDGTLDVNGTDIDNLTFQDCIISQGINISNHSTGGLLQDGRWSMIRSLYHSNKTRNPKARGIHEFVNSVLYNWREHGYIMGDTEGESQCNLVGNYFIYGPSSNANTHITGTTPSFRVYAKDNWVDNNKNGVNDAVTLMDYKTAKVETSAFAHAFNLSQAMPAKDALQYVIKNVGASIVRDAVDNLLIQQLSSYGTQGKILTTEDDNGIAGNVGTVAGGTAPKDTDKDGMPDDWETMRGFNPNVADDKGDDDKDGYTNIEEYLSCLVGEGDGCASTAPCTTVPAKPAVSNVTLCQGVVASALTATAASGNFLVWYGTNATGGTASATAPVPSTSTAGSVTYYVSQKTASGNCESARAGIVVNIKSCDCAGIENGTATKDNCDRCVGGTTGKTACAASSEIETEACSFDGAIESSNAGFKGTGYINTPNAIGSKITFNVNATAAGSYTLSFRYASGGTVDRPATVLLNGTALANTLSFPATANFTTYKTTDLSLSLKSGINTIQLTSTTAEGLANIDQIGYVSTGVTEGNCVVTSLDDINENQALVYPNPSKASFYVYTANTTNMQVVDMEGKMLEEHKNVSSLEFGFNLKPGIYLLKVDTKVYKVVKE
jgi:Carbohydrate binding module (family 35)/Ig-like domain CHU_C associated/Secretion system C-terminal sorting domain